MSDNKRPYDDEKVDINNLNDDLDKTKVFNINSKNDKQSNTDNYVSKHSLGNDEYGDDFFDNNEDSEEISSYSQADKANYKDDYDMGQVDDEPKPIVSRTDTYGMPKKKKSNNNKKPIIIGLIVAAVVLIIVAVVLALNSCSKDKNDNNSTTSTTETSTTVVTTTSEDYYTSQEETSEYTSEPTTEETTEPTTEETTEPTTEETTAEQTTAPNSDNGNAVNASFAPYKCITPKGDVISDDFANELKGDVSLSLNSNGTFNLNVGNIANESGNYEIDGNAITLGSYDGNIVFDNAGNPIGVTVYVDDYTVSFN